MGGHFLRVLPAGREAGGFRRLRFEGNFQDYEANTLGTDSVIPPGSKYKKLVTAAFAAPSMARRGRTAAQLVET